MADLSNPSSGACCECVNTNIIDHDLSAPHKTPPLPSVQKQFYPHGADVIFTAKTILTMNPAMPTTQAIAVRDGRIVALGQDALDAWQGPQTRLIDKGDAVLIPGFIETHAHPLIQGNCLRFVNVGYTQAKTKKEILNLIDAAAKKSTRPWVFAWNYDPFALSDKTPITRYELDEVSHGKHVVIIHNSLHFAYVNSLALQAGGLTKNTNDPEGGHLIRDSQGELTGELRELAAMKLLQVKIPKLSYQDAMEAGWLTGRAYQKVGVTSITDAGLGLCAGPEDASLYQDLMNAPDFPVRAVLCPTFDVLGALPLPRGFGHDRLRLGASKFIADGSLQGHTAFFTTDYYDRPGYKGICTVNKKQFFEEILKVHRAGLQIAIHANGDAAIDLSLDAIEAALSAHPRDNHRHRIEHCQVPREEQIARMATLGVLPNFFVSHVYYWGEAHREQSLGPERAENISPTQWAKKYGVPFTFHSDAPVTEPNPLHTLWIAVNRLTAEGRVLGALQRISAEDGLKALTIDAAYFNFEETIKGSIEVGKLADFTLLDKNPLTVDPLKIKDISVLGTVLGGVETQI